MKEIKSILNKQWFLLPSSLVLGLAVSIIVCLYSEGTIRPAVIGMTVVFFICLIFRFSTLSRRICLPLIVLVSYVLLDGISLLYASSRMYAYVEFLRVFGALLLALIALLITPEQEHGGRWLAYVLSVCTAILGLASIDLISTRTISSAYTGFLGLFSNAYQHLEGVESGVRIISIFNNPNCFAGTMGIGVLLSLGLAITVLPEENHADFLISRILLFVNSLTFLLVFSMGASAFIALAFIVFIFLESKQSRGRLFVLMAETLVLCLASAFWISSTSFQAWNGVQPVPLICVIGGSVLLCVVDLFIGIRLNRGHSRVLPFIPVGFIAVIALYLIIGLNYTGPVTLSPGENLDRALYLEPGTYALKADSSDASNISVTVKSQNQQETMMRTGTVLYEGTVGNAAEFKVPDDSLVVFFNISVPQGGTIRTLICETADGTSAAIPLAYKILPGFIARRLQGLKANENAIQRTVFFRDGMRIFGMSPVIGKGLGGFEDNVRSVQDFYYVTRYVHNHYIQKLVETGIIGLILFLGLLVSSGIAVYRKWKNDRHKTSLMPAFGAVLLFMAGHAFAETVFSDYVYLAIAFCVFALINMYCGDALPSAVIKPIIRYTVIGALAVLIGLFAVLVGQNLSARKMIEKNLSAASIQQAMETDVFEWPNYARVYISGAVSQYDCLSEGALKSVNQCAGRLSKIRSYDSVYLSEFYFRDGQMEKAFEQLGTFLDYDRSDDEAWNEAFRLLKEYRPADNSPDMEVYKKGVDMVIGKMAKWTDARMGMVRLTQESFEVLNEVRGLL